MASNVYSTIEEKSFDNGVAFILTPNAGIIEAHIFSSIIIFFKSIRLSFEQICSILSTGDVKDITFRKAEINPEIIQPKVIAQTFPGALSASSMHPARTPLNKSLNILQILPCLAKKENEDGRKAFDLVCKQIATHYRGFLSDVATLGVRVDKLSEEFDISTALLRKKAMPKDTYSIPGWVFDNFASFANGPMKDIILYYVFFGEVFKKMVRTNVEKEASLGAKQGYAVLSKEIYPELQDCKTASVYRGAEKHGDIMINWHGGKKGAFVTKADMDKLRLKEGDQVNLILQS
jgi:hypothetical protein